LLCLAAMALSNFIVLSCTFFYIYYMTESW
jgi:hypothetical protein